MPSEELDRERILHWQQIHEVVKTAGSAGVFVAIVALVLTVRHEIPKIRTELVPGVAAQLVEATHTEGRETRQTVKEVASDLSGKVDHRLAVLETAVLSKVGKSEIDANERIKDGLSIARDQIGEMNKTVAAAQKSLEKVASISDPLKKTIDRVNSSIAKIDEGMIDPLTDCEDNPDCFENRWKGIADDVETTLRAVSKEAPKMAAALQKNAENSASILSNVAGITADAHTFTTKFVNPPKRKWYQHIYDWLLVAAKLASYVL